MTSPVEYVRGASNLPARCISPAANISLALLDGSKTVVTPRANVAIAFQFCSGISSSVPCGPWAWASMKPGTIVLPSRSMTFTEPATEPARSISSPIAEIRFPSIKIVPFSITPPSLSDIVIMRAFVKATDPLGLSALTL